MLMGTCLIILSGNQIIYGLSWKLNTILANGWLNGEVLVQDSLLVHFKLNVKNQNNWRWITRWVIIKFVKERVTCM